MINLFDLFDGEISPAWVVSLEVTIPLAFEASLVIKIFLGNSLTMLLPLSLLLSSLRTV